MKKAPWRDVEHIEIHEGPKGGRYYWLKLVCGHFKSVTIRNFTILHPKIQYAPHHVRCWHCLIAQEGASPPST